MIGGVKEEGGQPYGFGWSRHQGGAIVNAMQSGGKTNRLHLRVYGRVQGVGFRCACYSQARALGLVGWVRNLPDDSVEIVAEGPSAALDAFRIWCSKGPIFARVDRVVNTPEPPLGTYRSFEIQDDWSE